jgi:hypothetical protein
MDVGVGVGVGASEARTFGRSYVYVCPYTYVLLVSINVCKTVTVITYLSSDGPGVFVCHRSGSKLQFNVGPFTRSVLSVAHVLRHLLTRLVIVLHCICMIVYCILQPGSNSELGYGTMNEVQGHLPVSAIIRIWHIHTFKTDTVGLVVDRSRRSSAFFSDQRERGYRGNRTRTRVRCTVPVMQSDRRMGLLRVRFNR